MGKSAYIWSVRSNKECYMEVNNKHPYESPEMEIVIVKTEGIVCVSGDLSGMPGYPGGGDPFNP